MAWYEATYRQQDEAEAAAKRAAWKADNREAVRRVFDKGIPGESEAGADPLAAVVHRALAHQPAERFADAATFARELARAGELAG